MAPRIAVALCLLASACTPALVKQAQKGDLEAIRALLAKHPDQETKDEALGDAVAGGRRDVAALLIDNGANPEARSQYGPSSLSVAVSRGDQAMVQLLLDKQADMAKALPAVNVAPPQIAQLFLNHGLNPNYQETDGATPLAHAACSGQTDLVRFWLEHGADPAKAGRACERSHFDPESVSLVCDIQATPMECARAKGYHEIEALLEAASKK